MGTELAKEFRFQFSSPVEVKTLQDGETANLVFRHVDIELNAKDMQTLKTLQAHSLENLIVEQGENLMKIEEVLEFAKSARSLEPLLEKRLPTVYLYSGILDFGYLPAELFLAGKPLPASFSHISMQAVKSYNIDANRVQIDSAITSMAPDKVLGFPQVSIHDVKIHDVKIQEYLQIQGRLAEIREQMMPRFGTFTDGNGRRMVYIGSPQSGSNVLRPEFGRKKCDDDLTK